MSSSDRRPWLTATEISQDFLDDCQDNLEFSLKIVSDVEVSEDQIIRTSDRHGYVGNKFYEARGKIPEVSRTVGEFLKPSIEFSTLKLSISNVDGAYSHILPGGENYSGLLNKRVTLRAGLRDVESSYIPIFRGLVTPVSGLSRGSKDITFIARDYFDTLNVEFPPAQFTKSKFPFMERTGDYIPIIYGDFSDMRVPIYVTNEIKVKEEENEDDIELTLSHNDLLSVSGIKVTRGDKSCSIDSGDISFGEGSKTLRIKQGGDTAIESEPYKFKSGDKFSCHVRGENLGEYQNNFIEQCRHIILTYGGAQESDFDESWDRYRDKSEPLESAVKDIRGRVFLNKKKTLVDYVLSLLEQVRIEMYPSMSLKLALSSYHFDEFEAEPDHEILNFDVEESSVKVKTDYKNMFNGAQGFFNFDPVTRENNDSTPIYVNEMAEEQLGKKDLKKIELPNIVNLEDAKNQVVELLKLASSFREFFEINLTPRNLLLDIGDWVLVYIEDSGLSLNGIPMRVRSIGLSPDFKIKVKLWSFQMTPFPGWEPDYTGIISGYNAEIKEL